MSGWNGWPASSGLYFSLKNWGSVEHLPQLGPLSGGSGEVTTIEISVKLAYTKDRLQPEQELASWTS